MSQTRSHPQTQDKHDPPGAHATAKKEGAAGHPPEGYQSFLCYKANYSCMASMWKNIREFLSVCKIAIGLGGTVQDRVDAERTANTSD
jgi:hypothetical protein